VRNGDQEPHDEPQAGLGYAASKPSGLRTSTYQEQTTDDSEAHNDIESEKEEVDAKIPVGVSRLHLVELPNLKVPSTPNFAARYLYLVDETNILESSA
jgi:hypothetical protein